MHSPVARGNKLNNHKTLRRYPGRLLNVLCAFSVVLHHMARGEFLKIVQSDVGGKLLTFNRAFMQSVLINLINFSFGQNAFHYICFITLKSSCFCMVTHNIVN